MSASLGRFERLVRSVADGTVGATLLGPADPEDLEQPHPFETRNIHPDLPKKVRELFDDGHYDHSVLEAFKYVEKEVKRRSSLRSKTGFPLMMDVFNEDRPKIQLNALCTESEIDEQRGYRHMFAGAAAGIRNPRAHEVDVSDSLDEALHYLALASLLLRRLDALATHVP